MEKRFLRRLTLPAASTSASVYMRTLILPEPGNTLEHALIVSP